MLRNDIDGILVWLTEEDKKAGRAALVLDYDKADKAKFRVFYLLANGNEGFSYDGLTLRQALWLFADEKLSG